MRKSLFDYCVEYDKEYILEQWHPTMNAHLTAKQVSYGSQKKVWWRCEHGHEWQAAIFTRTSGTNCPYCAGKIPCPGKNDLASQYPDIAAQWHPTKNNPLTPADVSIGSHHRAWWICEKGHEWQAAIKSRTAGNGCPFCTNRKISPGENDFSTTHPDLARQWHPSKNGDFTPHDLVAGS